MCDGATQKHMFRKAQQNLFYLTRKRGDVRGLHRSPLVVKLLLSGGAFRIWPVRGVFLCVDSSSIPALDPAELHIAPFTAGKVALAFPMVALPEVCFGGSLSSSFAILLSPLFRGRLQLFVPGRTSRRQSFHTWFTLKSSREAAVDTRPSDVELMGTNIPDWLSLGSSPNLLHEERWRRSRAEEGVAREAAERSRGVDVKVAPKLSWDILLRFAVLKAIGATGDLSTLDRGSPSCCPSASAKSAIGSVK